MQRRLWQQPVFTLVASAVMISACADTPSPAILEPSDNATAYQLDETYALPNISFDTTRIAFSHVPGPGQAQLVVNGGFELNGGVNSQVFTGWSNFNGPGDPNGFRVQTGGVSPSPGGVFTVPPPPEGNFTAMSTQGGPGTHILSQIISIPPSGNAQLSFRLFIGNRAGAFFSPPTLGTGSGPNQQFRMDIMNPASAITDVGAGVLMNVYQTKPGDPLISAGYLTVNANLAAFNGQTVRLRFAQVDNQFFFNAGVDHVSVIANVNQPPTANAGADRTVECTGAMTAVQLDGTATDPDNNITSIVWKEGSTTVGSGEDPIVNLAHGVHTLTLVVTDAAGAVATDQVTITVEDTTAPTVSVTASPDEIWPPNHKYQPVTLTIAFADACDPLSALTVTATAVSSEPDDANGNGDGNTTGDVKAGSSLSSNANPVVTFNPLTDQLEVRAERGGNTGPRTYTITVSVSDTHGNTGTATATVTVPKSRGN